MSQYVNAGGDVEGDIGTTPRSIVGLLEGRIGPWSEPDRTRVG